MKKIKQKIKSWLGITTLEKENNNLKKEINLYKEALSDWGIMGIDLGGSERDESVIVIASRAHGGVVKVIRTRFGGISEALELYKGLEARYGIREAIKDFPRGWRL